MHGKPLTKLSWLPAPEPDTPQPTRGHPTQHSSRLQERGREKSVTPPPLTPPLTLWPSDSMVKPRPQSEGAPLGHAPPSATSTSRHTHHKVRATLPSHSRWFRLGLQSEGTQGHGVVVGGNHRVAPAAERDRVAATRRIPRGAWAGCGRSKGSSRSSRCQTIEMLLPAALG